MVIGDLNVPAAETTVAEWKAVGGYVRFGKGKKNILCTNIDRPPCREALAIRSDVTRWDDQVALFKLAVDTYGRVDIVVANAGVGEIGQFDPFGEIMQKTPSKPTMVTPSVNVTGVLYSASTFERIRGIFRNCSKVFL